MPESPIFLQQLIRVWPPEVWRDVTVLVAVSGGPDSVALLRGLAAVRLQGSGQLIAAHFNHGLRGEQSEADEAFVVDLCRRLGITCEVGRADRDAGNAGRAGRGPEAGRRRPKRGPIAGRPLSVPVCDRLVKLGLDTWPRGTRRTIRRRRSSCASCAARGSRDWPASAGIGS